MAIGSIVEGFCKNSWKVACSTFISADGFFVVAGDVVRGVVSGETFVSGFSSTKPFVNSDRCSIFRVQTKAKRAAAPRTKNVGVDFMGFLFEAVTMSADKCL